MEAAGGKKERLCMADTKNNITSVWKVDISNLKNTAIGVDVYLPRLKFG